MSPARSTTSGRDSRRTDMRTTPSMHSKSRRVSTAVPQLASRSDWIAATQATLIQARPATVAEGRLPGAGEDAARSGSTSRVSTRRAGRRASPDMTRYRRPRQTGAPTGPPSWPSPARALARRGAGSTARGRARARRRGVRPRLKHYLAIRYTDPRLSDRWRARGPVLLLSQGQLAAGRHPVPRDHHGARIVHRLSVTARPPARPLGTQTTVCRTFPSGRYWGSNR